MRHAALTFAAACALLAPAALHAPVALAAPLPAVAAQAAEARVIVRYRADAEAPASGNAAQRAALLSRRSGLALIDGHPIGDRAQVVFAKGLSSQALAERLARDSDVELAAPDYRRRILAVPNDPLYAGGQPTATPTVGQWYLRPPTSTNVSAINAETAWNTTMGSSSVVVAVLDTGVRFDHPDLAGKLHAGYDFVHDAATANDGDGRDSDPTDPGDWLTAAELNQVGGPFYGGTNPGTSGPDCAGGGSPPFQAEDSSWHGTQVAGLIGAATANGIGMASVGRNVMVLPVRVLGKCGGYDSDIQAAMLWAAGVSTDPLVNPHPAKVINMSLGGSGACGSYQAVVDQVVAHGVTIVASAGNDDGKAVSTPANCSGVIAVAGVRHVGTKVGYSSLGPEVAISAPAGNCVATSGACQFPLLTTDNAGTTTASTSVYSDSFRASLGTSFSSPLVAGTAALMLSVNPALTPAQIKTFLQSSVRAFPITGALDPSASSCKPPSGTPQNECYCTTTTCGAGLLDAGRAVAAVVSQTPTVPISASSANPNVGDAVSLDGTLAAGRSGRTITTYEWTVSDPAVANFTSATNAATATLSALAAGVATATLTVTDSTGLKSAASATMTVGPVSAPVITPPAAAGGGGGGGGGGGALGLQWLLLLAGAIAALRAPRRR